MQGAWIMYHQARDTRVIRRILEAIVKALSKP